MTDYPDEIHADECREAGRRLWEVTLTYTITVHVDADRDASEDELRELADEVVHLNYDFRDADACELEDAEVVQ